MDVSWSDAWTLVLDVVADPFGSLKPLPAGERARLESASKLAYTGVWTVTPSLPAVPNSSFRLRYAD